MSLLVRAYDLPILQSQAIPFMSRHAQRLSVEVYWFLDLLPFVLHKYRRCTSRGTLRWLIKATIVQCLHPAQRETSSAIKVLLPSQV